MQEYELKILDRYALNVKSTRRVRGAFFCEAEEGLFLLKERVMVHGEYNYHNILICTDGIATTNFEKFRIHVQMEDFYYFLRKTMEKHEWDARLFDHMMNAYSAICPVTDREMEYLKARFIYPEKFWKIAGSYYKSNKAWTSVKNVEKFQMSVSQMKEKEKLLEEIFGFHR